MDQVANALARFANGRREYVSVELAGMPRVFVAAKDHPIAFLASVRTARDRIRASVEFGVPIIVGEAHQDLPFSIGVIMPARPVSVNRHSWPLTVSTMPTLAILPSATITFLDADPISIAMR